MLDSQDIIGLYDRHAGDLLAYFARRTLDAEAATDLVGETFATAFEQRRSSRARRPDERAAWLYAIARNLLTDHYRRGAVRRRAMGRLGVDRRPLTDAELERVDELAGLHDLRAAVASVLAEMPHEHREILRLRIVEERSYPDVAVTLGISQQTARARVSRALRGLRRNPILIDLMERPANA